MRMMDQGDGIDDNGGVPLTLKKNYIYVTWQWPANVANPTAFEVAIFTGTDPSVTNNYVVDLIRCLGTDRALQVAVPVKVQTSNINPAVRAVFG